MLTFKHTEIGYHTTLFQIEELNLLPGQLYTLIGRNGIGKTTFFQSLLGLVPIRKGEIGFDKINLKEIDRNKKAKLIAFVPSKFDGVQHLTGREFVSLGRAPYSNFTGKLHQVDLNVVDDVFERLGIEYLKSQDSSKMSDGERQILAIAKALVQETRIILLDEPTAFLDYPNRIKVLQLLRDIAQKQHICIIQSSHDIELAMRFCHEFLVIKSNSMQQTNSSALNLGQLLEVAF